MALTDNLVSHWKLDEESDGSAPVQRNDSHGTNHLTDNNTTASAVGKLGNAANFNEIAAPTSSLSITHAAQSGLDITTEDFAFSFWFNQNFSVNIFGRIFRKFATKGWQISQVATNGIRLLLNDGTSALASWVFTIPQNEWHHYVINCDRDGNAELFMDGGSKGVSTALSARLGSLSDATADFIISDQVSNVNLRFGAVDSLSVWVGRILTTDEIVALWNGGAGLDYEGFTPAASLIHWLIQPSRTIGGGVL